MDLKRALMLGEELLAVHGLNDWSIVLDRAKTRAGVCRPGNKQIGLSGYLTQLHPEDEVRDTILHEIAHALVGPSNGHNEVWTRKAQEIGCSGLRCSDPSMPKVEGHWIGTCPAGHIVRRHRRPERVSACGTCGNGKFDPAHIRTWTYGGRQAAMHPNYVAELEAIRAREIGRPDTPPALIAPGSRVRITAEGRFHGVEGQVLKRARTCFHVQLEHGVLRVPFSLVEEV